jgi:hypothetical protein
MIQSLLIANRGEIACRIMLTAQILPGTGRGTMRSMVEGQAGVGCGVWVGVGLEIAVANADLPLHQLRWFPSPVGGGFSS